MPKPIPEGYHSLTPSLVFKDAKKAVEFYKKAFGAQEKLALKLPDGRIMHAELQFGDSRIMLGEEQPQMDMKSAETLRGSPISLAYYVPDADAAFKKAVAAGCKAEQQPSDAFWGDRYGKVKDPFGYTWAILTHQKDVTPEQMQKAGQDFMLQASGRK